MTHRKAWEAVAVLSASAAVACAVAFVGSAIAGFR